jgi:hypothetical protein
VNGLHHAKLSHAPFFEKKSLVLLGKVQARVVRNLEEGFALEFVHEQLTETLEDSVTAR